MTLAMYTHRLHRIVAHFQNRQVTFLSERQVSTVQALSIGLRHVSRHAKREETLLPVDRMALFGATINLTTDDYKALKDAVYAVLSKTGPAEDPTAPPQYIALFTCPDLIAEAAAPSRESTNHD